MKSIKRIFMIGLLSLLIMPVSSFSKAKAAAPELPLVVQAEPQPNNAEDKRNMDWVLTNVNHGIVGHDTSTWDAPSITISHGSSTLTVNFFEGLGPVVGFANPDPLAFPGLPQEAYDHPEQYQIMSFDANALNGHNCTFSSTGKIFKDASAWTIRCIFLMRVADENGVPYTSALPDGTVIPTPLFLQNLHSLNYIQ